MEALARDLGMEMELPPPPAPASDPYQNDIRSIRCALTKGSDAHWHKKILHGGCSTGSMRWWVRHVIFLKSAAKGRWGGEVRGGHFHLSIFLLVSHTIRLVCVKILFTGDFKSTPQPHPSPPQIICSQVLFQITHLLSTYISVSPTSVTVTVTAPVTGNRHNPTRYFPRAPLSPFVRVTDFWFNTRVPFAATSYAAQSGGCALKGPPKIYLVAPNTTVWNSIRW